MPKNISVQNNFTRGLITEATGLNFPENAATDTSNCVFTLIGDVVRREGIDLETNYNKLSVSTTNDAISSFRWKNAGGDGNTELLVQQVGGTLYFYETSIATSASPISANKLSSTVALSSFVASGGSLSVSIECQYSSGNGYLFVFHKNLDPFFCTFSSGTVTGSVINTQIRDFSGIEEPGVPVTDRPSTLSAEHQYNLQNQGWASSAAWADDSSTLIGLVSNTNPFLNAGSASFTVGSTTDPVTPGTSVAIFGYIIYRTAGGVNYNLGCSMSGVVTSYSGTNMTVNVGTTQPPLASGFIAGSTAVGAFWNLGPYGAAAQISTWYGQVGVYPSNADVWWEFKDSTDVFNPAVTLPNVTLSSPAPTGSYIVSAFNINRSGVSSIGGLTSLTTTVRPKTGTWFQGRVFYAGVDASQAATGDATAYTWTENIYFSQIITPGDNTEFGYCYQINDPTSETLNELLPTDGGVIQIQGCGSIYKLYTIQNGLLVFAAEGIWFITGNSGLGFTADDYSINKISSVKTLSSNSILDVNGLPMFWNEEGIYTISPMQGNIPYGHGGLTTEPLTVGSILTFYNTIPKDSKIYARGDYNPLTYVVQWVYRSTQEAGISNRYQYDSALCFNVVNKAFYPYSISSVSGTTPYVSGIFYIDYPNSITAPDPTFKYVATTGTTLSFAEEQDDITYLDWNSVSGQNYVSFFTTAYNLQGKSIMKWQPTYVFMYLRDPSSAYAINGIWDFSISGNSGRQSTVEVVTGYNTNNFSMVRRRHKIRGHGESLQINVTSVQGSPFDIMGWGILTDVDAGV